MTDGKGYNELGKFAPSCLRSWSSSAVECYNSKFDCLHCPVYYLMESQECQMKAAVLELYKKFGEPTAENIRRSYDVANRPDMAYGKRKNNSKLYQKGVYNQ